MVRLVPKNKDCYDKRARVISYNLVTCRLCRSISSTRPEESHATPLQLHSVSAPFGHGSPCVELNNAFRAAQSLGSSIGPHSRAAAEEAAKRNTDAQLADLSRDVLFDAHQAISCFSKDGFRSWNRFRPVLETAAAEWQTSTPAPLR